jgi:hypothetical protein
MKYITDIDFLPEYKELHYDSYQLLYGIIVNHHEGMIYDTIISLCRKYREDILRMSKIDYWKHIVEEVITKLKMYNEEQANIMVYIPYSQLMCSPEMLLQRYIYAKMVLENVRGLAMNQLIRRGGTNYLQIGWFFPIMKLDKLMYDAVPHLANLHNKTEEEISKIIKDELIRRGIEEKSDNSSFDKEKTYAKVLFKGEYLANIPSSCDNEEDKEVISDRGYKLDCTGFIYYTLSHYFKQVRVQKKDNLDRLLKDAAYTITNGILKPDEKLNRSLKSGDTVYQYINKKIFNNEHTKIDTLIRLKTTLENCGITIPKELSEHFKE